MHSIGPSTSSHDPRALRIVAKSLYRQLRGHGLAERDVLAIATELLGVLAEELRDDDTAQRDSS